MLEGRTAAQRDLDGCEESADNNLMSFSEV